MRIYTDKTQDEEWEALGDLGHSGTLNERQWKYLGSLGYTGTLTDRFAQMSDGDILAPTVVSYSPADGGTDVAVDATLAIVFSETMDTTASTTVTLKTVGGAAIETFDSSTDGVWSTTTNTDDTWTATPASSFTNSASLAVQYSGFADVAGNTVSAVSDDTSWNFDVVAASGATIWRILINETVNPSDQYAEIREIELRSVASGSDLTSAADAPTRASAISEYPGNWYAKNAFLDDGAGSVWGSNTVPQPGSFWIQWEFAAATTVNEVTLLANSATTLYRPSSVTIQSSNDGTTFTDEFSDASLTYDGSSIATITRP